SISNADCGMARTDGCLLPRIGMDPCEPRNTRCAATIPSKKRFDELGRNHPGNARGGGPMSLAIARKIADAVLYEGYVLYPYRPSSLKNQFRWQFGIVAPPSWDGDPSFMQTECKIEPQGSPLLDVIIRFLQVQQKTTEWDEGIERV